LDDFSSLLGNEPPHQLGQGLDSIIRDFVPAVSAAEALKSRILALFSAIQRQPATVQSDTQKFVASTSHDSTADLMALISDASEYHYSTSHVNSSPTMIVVPNAVPPKAAPESEGAFRQSDAPGISQTPMPPTPQLVYAQTPFSADMCIRRTTSGESWTESGYGSVTCVNPDCVSGVGCFQCLDVSSFWDSNATGSSINWNETLNSTFPAFPAKLLGREDKDPLLPVISTTDMDHFLDQFPNFGWNTSHAQDTDDCGKSFD